MSYQATKEVDETEMHTPNERSQSKKKLHTVWFQSYDILEKAKLQRQLKDHRLPRTYEGGRCRGGALRTLGSCSSGKLFCMTRSWGAQDTVDTGMDTLYCTQCTREWWVHTDQNPENFIAQTVNLNINIFFKSFKRRGDSRMECSQWQKKLFYKCMRQSHQGEGGGGKVADLSLEMSRN